MRRVWKRNTKYYYEEPRKVAKQASKNANREQMIVKDTSVPSYKVMTRLRKRILNEFIYGKPSPAATRRTPWRFIFGENHHGLIGLLYSVALEVASLSGAVVSSGPQTNFTQRLSKLSRSIKRLDRMLRKLHIMRLFPWKRRPSRKVMLSVEW